MSSSNFDCPDSDLSSFSRNADLSSSNDSALSFLSSNPDLAQRYTDDLIRNSYNLNMIPFGKKWKMTLHPNVYEDAILLELGFDSKTIRQDTMMGHYSYITVPHGVTAKKICDNIFVFNKENKAALRIKLGNFNIIDVFTNKNENTIEFIKLVDPLFYQAAKVLENARKKLHALNCFSGRENSEADFKKAQQACDDRVKAFRPIMLRFMQNPQTVRDANKASEKMDQQFPSDNKSEIGCIRKNSDSAQTDNKASVKPESPKEKVRTTAHLAILGSHNMFSTEKEQHRVFHSTSNNNTSIANTRQKNT